jgi:integrase/recombinase XerD
MSADLDTLLRQFLRERKYLRNLRPQTLEWYETAWKAFRKSATHCLTDSAALNRAHLEHFIYALRDRGVKPVTCNTWLRALNAFCRWLHENGHTPTRVHMRPLRVEKRLVETLDSAAIHALVSFKPPLVVSVNKHHMDGPRKGQKNFAWWRIHVLACALLDTGCRVQELLDARVQDFDMDDLLVTVVGKGDKQRRIPFSIDLRRILFRYLQQRERFGVPAREPFMFPAHNGGAWDQRNALRSFYDLQRRLKLPRVGFHRLRHTFATEYLRRGGDVVRLSRTLGHTQITTTMRYLHLVTDDLSAEHAKVSMLVTSRR